MIRVIKYLLKIIFGISFYEPPKGLPVSGQILAEHFFSAEYRTDLLHHIPTFYENNRESPRA